MSAKWEGVQARSLGARPGYHRERQRLEGPAGGATLQQITLVWLNLQKDPIKALQ
jgi:hypothetical protein